MEAGPVTDQPFAPMALISFMCYAGEHSHCPGRDQMNLHYCPCICHKEKKTP